MERRINWKHEKMFRFPGIAGPRGPTGEPGSNGTPGLPGVKAYSVRINGSLSNELLIPPSIIGM